jgi:hypothetical protein
MSGHLSSGGREVSKGHSHFVRFPAVLAIVCTVSGLCTVGSAQEGGEWIEGFVPGGLNGWVQALAVRGQTVYAGGTCSAAGNVAANCVAKWDGTTWSALGSGLDGSVYALAVDGSGNL